MARHQSLLDNDNANMNSGDGKEGSGLLSNLIETPCKAVTSHAAPLDLARTVSLKEKPGVHEHCNEIRVSRWHCLGRPAVAWTLLLRSYRQGPSYLLENPDRRLYSASHHCFN
jgi:hypothetical protein